MIKKMIKKKPEQTFLALKKNLFYTPISTRHSTTNTEQNNVHDSSNKHNISRSFKKLKTSNSINIDLTQSFSKVSGECVKEYKNNTTTTNTTFIENQNSDESCFFQGKCALNNNGKVTKLGNYCNNANNFNLNINNRTNINSNIINESDFILKDDKMRCSLFKSESKPINDMISNDNNNNNNNKMLININDIKLINHNKIKDLIKQQIQILNQSNTIQCYSKVKSPNMSLLSSTSTYSRKDKYFFNSINNSSNINRNNISNGKVIKMSPSKNNYPLFNIPKQQQQNSSSKNITINILTSENVHSPTSTPLTSTNKDIVSKIVSELYKGMYNKLFNDISLLPCYLDRKYIRFNSLSKKNLAFLAPFFEVLFQTDISINKETFHVICDIIYNNLTINEKKDFVRENKLSR